MSNQQQAQKQAQAPANRQQLLDVLAKVGVQFDHVRGDIKGRERVIKAALDRVRSTAQTDCMSGTTLPASHPLRQLATASSAEIKAQFDKWVNDVYEHERGTQFHDRFGDSLLVFVYGKVKAGKSSLGNYLAYGCSEPDDASVAAARPQPDFFLEADTGTCEAMTSQRMKAQRRFGVGITETTSSIQGFTLPGLTWIDSPGIHSMTEVNGDLSKKYAGFADLIVFLSNSGSPGRRSDLAEISGLLQQGKPIVVLLTASDYVDEDEDDEGNIIRQRVMKSSKDRADQVAHMEEELANIAPELRERLLDLRVHPVSVKYAEEDSQAERWSDSGMAAFAARIAGIAGEQGLALKRATPLRNLMRFCGKLDQSAAQFDAMLTALRTQLEDERTEMRRAGDRIVTALRMDLAKKIERLADLHAMDDAGFAAACRKEVDASMKHHAETLFTQLGQSIEQSMAKAQAVMPIDPTLPGFGKYTEGRSYQSDTNEKRGAAGGGGILAVIGGLLGALAGPAGSVAGAGLGGWIGSKLGGYVGSQFDGEQEFDVDIGDNRQEVCLATRTQLIDRAERQIAQLCQQLDAACFGATDSWLQQCALALAALRHEVQSQRSAIGQELAASAYSHSPTSKELNHVAA